VFGEPDPERYAEIHDWVLQRAPGRGMLARRVVWSGLQPAWRFSHFGFVRRCRNVRPPGAGVAKTHVLMCG
jgi:hypothetical protein